MTVLLPASKPPAAAAIDLRSAALLLDIDGTLLDLAPTPDAVRVPPQLRSTLSALREQADGALALVSGRTIADIDSIFSPLRLAAVGAHGAEIRFDPAGPALEQRGAPLDPELKRRLKTLPAQHRNVLIEDKGHSIAVHYRLALEQGLAVVDEVYAICKPFSSDSYDLLPGKAVIEVKAPGFDKGMAVRALMQRPPFAGRMPIFIGDDTTDEAAFEVMPELKGMAISVGRKVPGVDHCFGTPDDVRRWLARISQTEAAPCRA